MPGQKDIPRGKLATRLITFYAIIAVIGVAVVIFVVSKGGDEKAQPAIAGGYTLASAAPCVGPVPKPPPGQPLPPTAPTQVPASGPSFNVLQSGQFVNFTNNQNTLGGQLRLNETTLPGGGHRLTGDVNCVSGGRSLKLDAIATGGAKGAIKGTLGGLPFAASLTSAPPAAGAAAPRTPTNIQGTYALTPASTCFGSKFLIHGTGAVAQLYSSSKKFLGPVTYSSKTAGVFGDVKCIKGGSARMTATANDLQLQKVTVIPLNVATPVPSTASKPKPALTTPTGLSPAGEKFTATKARKDFNALVAAVFLAIAIVLIVARLFGAIATRVGQPRVMGEVIAGLCLGPSLLGAISPNLQATFFPSDILPALGVVANLGLIFYMFLVGLEVDRGSLKGKVAAATAISNTSVAVPMLLGIAVALPLYKLVGPNTKFVSFALFMGVAMSITAFPVLARILAERRMIKRPIGSLAIACAAVDDVTAWFLIALALTVAASGTFGDVVKTIAEATAYTLIMVLVVKRIIGRMGTAYDEVGRLPGAWFAAIIIGVLLSAYVTEEINIAFIFGGFVFGMIMPRHARMNEEVTRRIDDFVVTLLLPVFFVYTGLRTNVGLLDRPELWLITLLLIAVAILGKLFGAAMAARVVGYNWKASSVIGTLMNTRGLTELIVLNLALDAGAISNSLFAMLVIMAVVTTLMAGPLLKLLDPKNEYGRGIEDEFADAALAAVQAHPELPVPDRSILVAPQTDGAIGQLVALAEPLARSEPARELIIARLVQPPRGAGAGVRGGLQSENLALERATRAINDLRERLASDGVVARGVALTSSSPGSDLAHIVEREPVDLVLTEGRRRLIGEGVPLGEVGELMENAVCDVAVLVAKEGDPVALGPDSPILVPFGGAEHDWAALELGSWLASNTGAPLRLLGAAGQTDEGKSVTRLLADAGLLVQQATGIATEPLVVAGGRDGIVAAAETAGLLVLGLSDRWRKEGLGPTRSAIAKAAPAPVLFVRRGSRPGLFAPKEDVTQFKWSMAGGPGMLGLSPRSVSGAQAAVPADAPSPGEPPISVS
ncbi:MAG TPA: cation:proton antiporter [Solirubrobacteraceae bacterium]|nr:cation:proton antiporter [Solirubrobacteraceae bacterium]